MPPFIARLYDNLTSVRGINKSFEEIAEFIGNILTHGKLLDIGTGPGRLLDVIHRRIPQMNLFGIDISKSMIDLARQNLANVPDVNLRTGNIGQTDYPVDFFDFIVSTGSFYNWDDPVKSLDEVFRILKPGRNAYIFDTYKEFDRKLLNVRLKENLDGYNLIRKTLSKFFLRKQLGMTYSIKEIDQILKQTRFKDSYNIQIIELGNLPIHVRLELRKT